MIKNGLGRCSSFLTVLLLTMALTGCSRQTDDTKQHFSNTSDGLITADTDIVTEENTETILSAPDNETPAESISIFKIEKLRSARAHSHYEVSRREKRACALPTG